MTRAIDAALLTVQVPSVVVAVSRTVLYQPAVPCCVSRYHMDCQPRGRGGVLEKAGVAVCPFVLVSQQV